MSTQVITSGVYEGTQVQSGKGGGLASHSFIKSEATHYHAAAIHQLGNVVLAVTRRLDPVSAATTHLILRAFAATSPNRNNIAQLEKREFLSSAGALAISEMSLALPGDEPDVRGTVVLNYLNFTDAVISAAAMQELGDLLCSTWEAELSFGSWPALRGNINVIKAGGAISGADIANWLVEREYNISETGSVLKVLSAAWLENAAQ